LHGDHLDTVRPEPPEWSLLFFVAMLMLGVMQFWLFFSCACARQGTERQSQFVVGGIKHLYELSLLRTLKP
jgi:hypothetical protein